MLETPKTSVAISAKASPAVHTFNVYGYRFSIQGESSSLQGVLEDFAFFADTNGPGKVSIELVNDHPPFASVPHVDAAVYTPRNVVYRDGSARYIDYHGRGLGIHDHATGDFRVFSKDADLLYETAYLFLLSQIGQHLDKRGLHRIHALGIAIKGRAVLVLLPMGGGKSTLALDLLKNPAVKLLSDDSPYIDRQGQLWSYPLRLGLLPGSERFIPPNQRRLIQRMEFGPKYLVNYSFFKDRVCPSAEPGFVFLGARTLAPTCRIDEVGVGAALRACVSNCIVGMGLFQGLEFILQSSALELLNQSTVGASRLRNCYKLLRRSQLRRIHLGRDRELNARTLFEYVDSRLGESS